MVRFEKDISAARLVGVIIGVGEVSAQEDGRTVGHGHRACRQGCGAVPEVQCGELVDASVEGRVDGVVWVAVADDAGGCLDTFEGAPTFACAEGRGFVLFAECRQWVEGGLVCLAIHGVPER